MAYKKQVIVFSVIFDDHDTYGESAESAISHALFNIDGIKEWDSKVKSEESLVVDLTEKDLED